MAKNYPPIQIGMSFSELTVIEEDYEKEKEQIESGKQKRRFFKCKCSCGKIVSVQKEQLNNGKTKSCGHLQKERSGRKPTDLSGMKFDNLYVLHMDTSKPRRAGKHKYWICQCELCGTTKSIRSSNLLEGKARDCGCRKTERISESSIQDLSGNMYGYLKVIERSGGACVGGGVHTAWMCECTLCGHQEIVSSAMLTRYGKDRCKMCSGLSIGEEKIHTLLTDNNISFVHDRSYSDCKIPTTGCRARFDFRINQNSDCDYFIEFDGEQHFKSVPQYDTKIPFQERVSRDKFKDEWCKSHNIPIIRIPYTRLNKLCIEDLCLNTTAFLVG